MSAETTTMAVPDWLGRPVELAPQVTLIDGADGHPLLFNAATGAYVRLSPTGARVMPLLDGSRTGTALLDAARRSRGPDGVRDRSPILLSFLSDLRAAGALSEPPEPPRGGRRLVYFLFSLAPHFRMPARRLNLLLGPPAAVLARFPRTACAAGVLLAIAAAVAVTLAMVLPVPAIYFGPPWLLIVMVLLVQAAVHEIGHATVCQALGVPVREFGVKLFFLLIPLTYVDRTDAYRLKSRASRSAVALVGPLVDLTSAGVSGLLIVLAPEDFGHLRWLLGMQLFLVFNNLNPLLPFTDGHHAMEAAAGEVNLRHRAFAYLGHVVFRMPLSAAHRQVPARRRRMYLAYGVVSAIYVALVLTVIAFNYYRIALLATG